MKKRILKWLGITLGVVLLAAAGLWAMFGTFIRAANSIKKLEDGLYTMEFTGDYGFDKFLAQGVGSQQSHQRYDTLAAYTGPAGMSEICGLLESVSQKNYPLTDGSYEKTMWSIVYCPEEHRADFYFRENYQRSYGLLLSEAIQENGQ